MSAMDEWHEEGSMLEKELPSVMEKMLESETKQSSKQQCDKSSTSLWCLPNEILVHILRGLHIGDLFCLQFAHPHFCDLIDNHSSIWTTVSFSNVWPCKQNLKYFERAAKHSNVEALIKLGVACLYNVGVHGAHRVHDDSKEKKIVTYGEKAAQMFIQAESQLTGIVPFTFLFIRPPWSTLSNGSCCKEFVFKWMVDHVKTHPVASVHLSIYRTLYLLEGQPCETSMTYHLTRAAELGSSHAKYILWQKKYKEMTYPSIRQKIHELSLLTVEGCSIDAIVDLCQAYTKGQYGKLSQSEAAAYVSQFIHTSKPTHINKMFAFKEITCAMRYILMDWLVEVANMKNYCSLTLHLAIHAVDRFLMRQRITRAKLQLVGVSAMVLCSRFLGKDIITVREAAWLTDNAYNYEDVVRMMGEICATLRGNLRVLTSLDFVQVINLCSDNDRRDDVCSVLCEYICELALLKSEFGEVAQGEVACACVMLARAVLGKECIWTKKMEQFTGYTVNDLKHRVADIHMKCEPSMIDSRSVELQAVKHRYADEDYMEVSSITMIDHSSLCKVLGIPTKEELNISISSIHCKDIAGDEQIPQPNIPVEIITSPSRSRPNNTKERKEPLSPLREKNATPILEKKLSASGLNVEASGACNLGDDEDEQDTVMACEEESALDLESLWCVDNIDVYAEEDILQSAKSSSKTNTTKADDVCSTVGSPSDVNGASQVKDLSKYSVGKTTTASIVEDLHTVKEVVLLSSPGVLSAYSISPTTTPNVRDTQPDFSIRSTCSGDVALKNLKTNELLVSDSHTSPTPSTSLMSTLNGSPIGGMTLFKDSNNTRQHNQPPKCGNTHSSFLERQSSQAHGMDIWKDGSTCDLESLCNVEVGAGKAWMSSHRAFTPTNDTQSRNSFVSPADNVTFNRSCAHTIGSKSTAVVNVDSQSIDENIKIAEDIGSLSPGVLSAYNISSKSVSSVNNSKLSGTDNVLSFHGNQSLSKPRSERELHSSNKSSSKPSTPLMSGFNGSPIGGMNFFKVDTPNNARYIQSGIKIDFSNKKKASLSLLNGRNKVSSRNNTLWKALSKSSKLLPLSSSSLSSNRNVKHNNNDVEKSINDVNNELTFKIYKDLTSEGTNNETNNNLHSDKSSVTYGSQNTLRERNSNVKHTHHRSKKRKPSASLGNESKVQVISDH